MARYSLFLSEQKVDTMATYHARQVWNIVEHLEPTKTEKLAIATGRQR